MHFAVLALESEPTDPRLWRLAPSATVRLGVRSPLGEFGLDVRIVATLRQLTLSQRLHDAPRPLAHRENRADRAIYYPSHHIFENFRPRKRPALCALFDGLFVSAGAHFKKDRQKYRQPIRLLTPETAQRFINFLFSSISYEVTGGKLTMYCRSSLILDKPLD